MAKEKAKKAVTAEDLRAKSPDELKKLAVELKKQQFNLRFQKAGGQLANTSVIRNVRRDVARLKTIATEKTAGAVKPAKAKTAKPAAPKAAKAPAKAKAKATA